MMTQFTNCHHARRGTALLLLLALPLMASPAQAHDKHSGGVPAPESPSTNADFDIVHAKITTQGNTARFHMAVTGKAGASKPSRTGKLGGARVFSYVWPTSMDPHEVGFEHDAGILALAVTVHPDFDDTPLFDENNDRDRNNDGNLWHSHWVVLQPNEECGPGKLGVVDIPEGAQPRLPKTWPGLPILIDSPNWQPVFDDDVVEVEVAFDNAAAIAKASFDGVTSGLRVNESVHAPLLCVVDVFDVASGDLSLPGKVEKQK